MFLGASFSLVVNHKGDFVVVVGEEGCGLGLGLIAMPRSG